MIYLYKDLTKLGKNDFNIKKMLEKQELYIDARKVRTNEDITKYQVKTNDNYKMLTKGISQENG